jgi:DNA-binding MarR family transcriptional regulator
MKHEEPKDSLRPDFVCPGWTECELHANEHQIESSSRPELEVGAQFAEHAARLEHLMPTILRRLFSLSHAGILAEMPLAQLRVCSYLFEGPRSMSAISEELGMSTSAVTQIADRMERSGLVERISAQDDRRLKYLHLTEQAKALMEDRRIRRTRRAQEALALLPAAVRDDLLAGLEQLLQATVATAPPADTTTWDPVDTPVR